MTPTQPSGWAVGGAVFAGASMLLVGVFHFIEGLVAIINDNFFVVGAHYTFNLDTTAWGWIHLIIGAVILLVGLALLAGQSWAFYTGILLALLSAVANFFFIPYYPVWSIVVIAIDVFVVWSLARVIDASRA
ncbi:MAG TPA: hypothetical protein VGJ11_04265 [Gaiellales bacterium]